MILKLDNRAAFRDHTGFVGGDGVGVPVLFTLGLLIHEHPIVFVDQRDEPVRVPRYQCVGVGVIANKLCETFIRVLESAVLENHDAGDGLSVERA